MFEYVTSILLVHVSASMHVLLVGHHLCVGAVQHPLRGLWNTGGLSLFVQKLHIINKERILKPLNRNKVSTIHFIFLSVILDMNDIQEMGIHQSPCFLYFFCFWIKWLKKEFSQMRLVCPEDTFDTMRIYNLQIL